MGSRLRRCVIVLIVQTRKFPSPEQHPSIMVLSYIYTWSHVYMYITYIYFTYIYIYISKILAIINSMTNLKLIFLRLAFDWMFHLVSKLFNIQDKISS